MRTPSLYKHVDSLVDLSRRFAGLADDPLPPDQALHTLRALGSAPLTGASADQHLPAPL